MERTAAKSRGDWPPAVMLATLTMLYGIQGCALRRPPTGEALQKNTLDHAQIPGAWRAGEAQDLSAEVVDGWLGQFKDEALQAMVKEALVYNADLRAAAAGVERARALVEVARGELYPAINALGLAGTNDSADTSGLAGAIVSASWELDLWGRVRYGARAGREEYAALQADYAFARHSLAALVAKSWFMAIEATDQRNLANEMVDTASHLADFAETRRRIGIGSEFEVVTSRMSLSIYRDSAVQLDLAREQALRALEILLGRYPLGELAVARRLPELGAAVPAGLPSQLLERRPDVIAAERRVGAAFNRARQARAARLPTLSLTGSGSDLSSDLFVLKERDNPVWGIGGRVFAPLFAGGALKAQVAVKTAEQHEAMATYAATALKAFAEVENALSSARVLDRREVLLAASATDSHRAMDVAEIRVRVGSEDLRAVEQQQLAWYSARTTLLRVRTERLVQRVNLHLALGGAFDSGP